MSPTLVAIIFLYYIFFLVFILVIMYEIRESGLAVK